MCGCARMYVYVCVCICVCVCVCSCVCVCYSAVAELLLPIDWQKNVHTCYYVAPGGSSHCNYHHHHHLPFPHPHPLLLLRAATAAITAVRCSRADRRCEREEATTSRGGRWTDADIRTDGRTVGRADGRTVLAEPWKGARASPGLATDIIALNDGRTGID